MEKMAKHGDGIMLIPNAPETLAFKRWVWPYAQAICFLKKRPHFHYVDGTEARANSGCSIALVAYGESNTAILERAGLGKTFRISNHSAGDGADTRSMAGAQADKGSASSPAPSHP